MRAKILLAAALALGGVAVCEAAGRPDGLTPDQAARGCVPDGRVIRCPPSGDVPKVKRPTVYPATAIFGKRWGLHVPGAAYQTEDRVNNTRTLHLAPGTRVLGDLMVSPDGRYVWRNEDGIIRGRWVRTDAATLVLQRGLKGKNWSAQLDENGLTLWTGANLAEQFRGAPLD